MNMTTLTHRVPFYYSPRLMLFDGLPDYYLELAAPIVTYWVTSFFFHILDTSGWAWLDRYRIHSSAEVQNRNRVSRTEVLLAVVFQHVVQTALGLLTLSKEPHRTMEDHIAEIVRLETWMTRIPWNIGAHDLLGQTIARDGGWYLYWWAIPIVQFLFALFIIDTWQYFLHRAMHLNKFLYRQFHSWHHRLYVPYAFGALYNHPVEGFLLDSLGAVVARQLTGMNARQAALFYGFCTLKTVDDHCGYSLPFDPLQLMTSNNADYHDIHHQAIGIKSNFAQPFFVHWDAILGTRMTREDLKARQLNQKQGIKNE